MMKSCILRVRSMYCEECIASVVSAISVIRGVHFVTVAPRHGEITVGYDETKAQADQFILAARVMGYVAEEVSPATLASPIPTGICSHRSQEMAVRYRAA